MSKGPWVRTVKRVRHVMRYLEDHPGMKKHYVVRWIAQTFVVSSWQARRILKFAMQDEDKGKRSRVFGGGER